jgi:hypothetical protein
MFAGSQTGQTGATPRSRLMTRPDSQARGSIHAAGSAAAESTLLFVIGGVAGHSAPGGGGLHEILVGPRSVLVEQAVERFLVDPRLGELNLTNVDN